MTQARWKLMSYSGYAWSLLCRIPDTGLLGQDGAVVGLHRTDGISANKFAKAREAAMFILLRDKWGRHHGR